MDEMLYLQKEIKKIEGTLLKTLVLKNVRWVWTSENQKILYSIRIEFIQNFFILRSPLKKLSFKVILIMLFLICIFIILHSFYLL